MPRYTPGPWKIRPNGELWSYARGENPTQVGTMYWGGKQEDRDGNGRIIASAASMVESLDEIMLLLSQPEVVEVIQNTGRISAKAKMVMESAREALEEATGKKLPEWPKSDPYDQRLES